MASKCSLAGIVCLLFCVGLASASYSENNFGRPQVLSDLYGTLTVRDPLKHPFAWPDMPLYLAHTFAAFREVATDDFNEESDQQYIRIIMIYLRKAIERFFKLARKEIQDNTDLDEADIETAISANGMLKTLVISYFNASIFTWLEIEERDVTVVHEGNGALNMVSLVDSQVKIERANKLVMCKRDAGSADALPVFEDPDHLIQLFKAGRKIHKRVPRENTKTVYFCTNYRDSVLNVSQKVSFYVMIHEVKFPRKEIESFSDPHLRFYYTYQKQQSGVMTQEVFNGILNFEIVYEETLSP